MGRTIKNGRFCIYNGNEKKEQIEKFLNENINLYDRRGE